jgi:hypothetical protein
VEFEELCNSAGERARLFVSSAIAEHFQDSIARVVERRRNMLERHAAHEGIEHIGSILEVRERFGRKRFYGPDGSIGGL